MVLILPKKKLPCLQQAVDLAKAAGIHKNFEENYITELSAREYAEIYTNLKISPKYINYLSTLSAISD